MQFIEGLSAIVVAILALISGLTVVVGSRKEAKLKASVFCALAVMVAVWSGVVASLFFNGLGNGWLLLGPVLFGVGIVGFYCAILRHRIILVDAKWLRFLSYTVVMAAVAIVYMFIFYMVYVYIFKFEDLSGPMFVLNYVMIMIMLVLFPIANEITDFVNSIIRNDQVDLTYIIRRMNKLATEDVDLDELAKFLARRLHFNYIGFIVGGKLYGSRPLVVSRAELRPLTDLGDPEYGIWQELDGTAGVLCENLGVKAVAELRNAKGESFGQILVGKPLGKMGFERKDLIQLETIVNLVAAMIDTRAKRARR